MRRQRRLRILIIADAYHKVSFAPRLRFLCDFLTQKGHYIEVFTEKDVPLKFQHKYPIHQIEIYRTGLFIERVFKKILSLAFNWKEEEVYSLIINEIKNSYYDCVFCTTASIFPLFTACWIAEARRIPLFVDVRDIFEQIDNQYFTNSWKQKIFKYIFRPIHISRRNAVLSYATAVTTTSSWNADFLKKNNPNTCLIYDGFDPNQFFFSPVRVENFVISYIGNLYDWHDASLLKQAVDGLSLPHLQVHFHSVISPPIPHDEVGEAIRKSSIMLVLANPHAKGVMTTKFYEALGCEKPVLCIPSDNGILAETIQKLNAGIATSDVTTIRQFIKNKYQEWQTFGYTHQLVKKELKNDFSREKQAQQMEEILLDKTPQTPRVSVIVPVFNAEKYLHDCLKSILTQTFDNLQIILVDDGSTDDSLRIMKEFQAEDERIEIVKQEHSGQAVARNSGLKLVNGDYISFVDADDTIERNFYATMIAHIVDNEVIMCGFKRTNDDGKIISKKIPGTFYTNTSSCLRIYKTEFFLKNQLHFQSGFYCEDVIFSLQLWKVNPRHKMLPFYGYNYRQKPFSRVASVSQQDKQRLWDFLWQEFLHNSLKMKGLVALMWLRLKIHFLLNDEIRSRIYARKG